MRKKQDIMWDQSPLITKQIQAIKIEFSKSEFHFSADGYNNAFTESFASPYGYTLRTPYENKLQNR